MTTYTMPSHAYGRGMHLPGRCVRCDWFYRDRAGLTGSGLLTAREVTFIPERLLTAELDDDEYEAEQASWTQTPTGRHPLGWGFTPPAPVVRHDPDERRAFRVAEEVADAHPEYFTDHRFPFDY